MTIIFKIISLPGMIAFIFLMLMIMGIIPYNRTIRFLKKHRIAQLVFAIMVGTGFLSLFFVVANISI